MVRRKYFVGNFPQDTSLGVCALPVRREKQLGKSSEAGGVILRVVRNCSRSTECTPQPAGVLAEHLLSCAYERPPFLRCLSALSCSGDRVDQGLSDRPLEGVKALQVGLPQRRQLLLYVLCALFRRRARRSCFRQSSVPLFELRRVLRLYLSQGGRDGCTAAREGGSGAVSVFSRNGPSAGNGRMEQGCAYQ